MTSNTWKVRALRASRPENPDPIKMQVGDLLEIVGPEDEGWIWCRNRAGKESWVPLSYIAAEGEGNTRTALFDYDATELPVEVPTGCATRLQQANCIMLMTVTSRFTMIVSLLAASWAWFQDRKMTIRQRPIQRRFTRKCISLRNPWVIGDI